MATVSSTGARSLLIVALVACSSRGTDGPRRSAANGEVARLPQGLLDSARSAEAAGDVQQAVTAYRRLLSLAPQSAAADSARTRLAAIVAGPAPQVRVNMGALPPLPSGERRDPTVAPQASRTATTGALRPASRPASGRRRGVTSVASRGAPLRHSGVPLRHSGAPLRHSYHPLYPERAAGGTVTRRAATTSAAASSAAPKAKRRRLARAGHWVVAKAAGLGAAGGVVVGALIGNVPGAIAMGMASGAAVGAHKAQRESPTVPARR